MHDQIQFNSFSPGGKGVWCRISSWQIAKNLFPSSQSPSDVKSSSCTRRSRYWSVFWWHKIYVYIHKILRKKKNCQHSHSMTTDDSNMKSGYKWVIPGAVRHLIKHVIGWDIHAMAAAPIWKRLEWLGGKKPNPLAWSVSDREYHPISATLPQHWICKKGI